MELDSVLQALLANIDEGVHVVDEAGITVLYNPQAAQNDGLTAEEAMGKHVLSVFPSLDEASSTLLRVLKTGEPIINQQQTFTNYKGFRVTTINSTWPIHQQGRLVGAIEIAKDVTRVRELSEQLVHLQAELIRRRRGKGAPRQEARYTFADLLGWDPRWAMVKEHALRAAQSESPILVFGETGTGKELLVHAIHQASGRRNGPFVAQNCAALPEGLLEGILFGTAKGSFTGAEDRVGLFELADGGTLYLDEINSMEVNLQAKLLRALQDGRIRRLGESRERAVDVRIIASTNEDPLQAVEQRRIRQDLYYRINVFTIELPALRERGSDIAMLAEAFLQKHRGDGLRFAPEVLQFFSTYRWPGNVRELEHAVEAGLHVASGNLIKLADLPRHLQRLGAVAVPEVAVERAGQLRGALAEAERSAILDALRRHNWNLSRAAAALGVPRQTLQYRIKVYGLSRSALEGGV